MNADGAHERAKPQPPIRRHLPPPTEGQTGAIFRPSFRRRKQSGRSAIE
jgi:hypothetical protein